MVTLGTERFDCTQCGCLEPNPDIAGIGAIIAFAISSGLTLLFCILSLIFDIIACKHGGVHAYPIIRQPARTNERIALRIRKWTAHLFFPMIFSLSDTQLITTVAIMISTWVELSKGLSVYHFTVISNLVWLACNTQILAFLSLRHSVKSLASLPNRRREDDQGQLPDTNHNSRHNRCCDYPDLRPYLFPPSRYLRALLMFCQFGMMVTVVTLQIHKDWYRAFNCPVICVTKDFKPGGNQLATTISSYLLLLWAYGTTLVPLILGGGLDESGVIDRVGRAWLQWLDRKGLKVIKVICTFSSSMTFDVIFSTVWYVMGVFFLVQTRIVAIPYFKMEGCEGNEQEERLWSFGQLVPMLLLLAPMIATMDAYSKVSTGGRDLHQTRCCHKVGTSPTAVSPRSEEERREVVTGSKESVLSVPPTVTQQTASEGPQYSKDTRTASIQTPAIQQTTSREP